MWCTPKRATPYRQCALAGPTFLSQKRPSQRKPDQSTSIPQLNSEDAKSENNATLAISPKSETFTVQVNPKPPPGLPFASSFFASSRLCCSRRLADRLLLILPGSAQGLVNEVSVSQQLARRDRHCLHAGNNPERANAAQAPAPLGVNLRFDPDSVLLRVVAGGKGLAVSEKVHFACKIQVAGRV